MSVPAPLLSRTVDKLKKNETIEDLKNQGYLVMTVQEFGDQVTIQFKHKDVPVRPGLEFVD